MTNRDTILIPGSAGCRVARASPVLAKASPPSRTSQKRLFRRDAETSTRDTCATQNQQTERPQGAALSFVLR
jgi:hypothetical protein